MDRTPARRSGRRFPGEGHGVPQGDGGARQIQGALPRLRLARSAHPLRGQRGELLRDLSDGRQGPRRSLVVAPAEGRLAALARRVGSEDRMIETFLVAHPFVAVGVWVLLFISDYYLTLWGAREYRRNARVHIELAGSYELEPRFQKAIDELRHISPQIAFRLLLFAAGLLLLWWLSVRNAGNPAFFLVVFGAYALTQVVVQMRHIRNIVSFRAFGVPDAVTGHIKYSRWVTRRISNVDILSFAVLYALCYALSGRVIFIGGVLGCLSVVRRHVAAARLERNGIRRALPADAVSVARIHVESWKIAYRGIMPDEVIVRTDVAYRTEFWKERIADPAWPVFLLEERGVPLAFCQIIASRDGDDDAARVAHITSLHVLPQLRGRGHGRALIDHAIAALRRLPRPHVRRRAPRRDVRGSFLRRFGRLRGVPAALSRRAVRVSGARGTSARCGVGRGDRLRPGGRGSGPLVQPRDRNRCERGANRVGNASGERQLPRGTGGAEWLGRRVDRPGDRGASGPLVRPPAVLGRGAAGATAAGGDGDLVLWSVRDLSTDRRNHASLLQRGCGPVLAAGTAARRGTLPNHRFSICRTCRSGVRDRAAAHARGRRRVHPHLVGHSRLHEGASRGSGRWPHGRVGRGLGSTTAITLGTLAGRHARREDLMKEWITVVITRELKALRREIESYPTEGDLWE